MLAYNGIVIKIKRFSTDSNYNFISKAKEVCASCIYLNLIPKITQHNRDSVSKKRLLSMLTREIWKKIFFPKLSEHPLLKNGNEGQMQELLRLVSSYERVMILCFHFSRSLENMS